MLCLFSIIVFAESGYVETGGISVVQKSNITPLVLGNNRLISPTFTNWQTQSEIDPYFSFEYKNKINNMQVTTSFNEQEKLSLTINKNNYGAGLFVAPSYQYENPYQLNLRRQTTLSTESGVVLMRDFNINNDTGTNLSYTLSKIVLQNDLIGKQIQALSRNGYMHIVDCVITNSLVKLTTGVLNTNSMGSAEKYKGAHAQLSSTYSFGNVQMYGAVNFERKLYNGINPMFNQTREQSNIKTLLSIEIDFISNYYATISTVHIKNTGNIKFYNEFRNEILIGVGKNF